MRGRGRRKRHCRLRGRFGQRHVLLNHVQAGGGFARNAGHHQQIAGLRARARQPFVCLDPAGELHRHDQRPAHRVAADERDVVLLGELQQSGREARDPWLGRFGQRQRQRHPCGLGAHRGDVAEIHRERAIADSRSHRCCAESARLRRSCPSRRRACDRRATSSTAASSPTPSSTSARSLVAREVTGDDVEFASSGTHERQDSRRRQARLPATAVRPRAARGRRGPAPR